MSWQIYLSGEIHTDWRKRIEAGARDAGLDVTFTAPVADHAASDDAGTAPPRRPGTAVLERPHRRRGERHPHAAR